MAIGVSPARLDFTLKKGDSQSQKIFLQNLGGSSTKVALRVSETKYDRQVSVSPTELILPPREIEEVEIKISPAKSFHTEIEIAELAKTQGTLEVAGGVRLPLQIDVSGGLNSYSWILPLGLAVLTTLAIFYYRRRKLKQI